MAYFLIVNLLIPAALAAWIVFAPLPGRWPLALQSLASLALVAASGLVSLWAEFPLPLPFVLAAVIMAATVRHQIFRRAKPAPRTRRRTIGVAGLLSMAGLAAMAVYVIPALAGRSLARDAGVADVAFPLRGVDAIVAHGGSTIVVNPHMKTLDPEIARFAAWRGQSYAVDLLGYAPSRFLDWSKRADPASYPIWGAIVIAPCDGRVKHIVSDAPDMPVPQMDREHMTGNSVLLDCGDFEVLLGHLQHGSIGVSLGDNLAIGDPVGLVGNSGNSSEPHLHIHAQMPSPDNRPFAGEPMQLRFGGRYPVRNMLFRKD